ncbi:MAG: DNA-processing protein DprA [Synechococcus sp. TMED20]|jgi:DNA processing protein|nr:MAG: DNA-processing protein DprA [Synechococcus sp. TMED20]
MRAWWWLWSRCPGIGAARMRMLEAVAVEHGVGLEDLWTWPIDRLQRALAWPNSLVQQVDYFRRISGAAPDLNVPGDVILPGDPSWPVLLNELQRPPLALFHRGRSELLAVIAQQRCVAVVGTRSASPHGLHAAAELSSALALAGWPVLSGLAEGIDAAALRACLNAGGSPIAVLGTPLNRAYPSHHRRLQAAIGEKGLLLTEQAHAAPVRRGHFAARNRLLVALSCAVVVVECPERSGALITARCAVEQQCPVWVVPGDAGRGSARGSNALLLDKAAPLLSPQQLIHHLGEGPLPSQSPVVSVRTEWSHSDQRLLEALEHGASLEELSRVLNRPSARLAKDLLALELQGRVLCESGHRWRPIPG